MIYFLGLNKEIYEKENLFLRSQIGPYLCLKILDHIRNLGFDSIPCRQLVVRDLGIPYWGFIQSYVTEFINEFYKSDRQ